MRFMRWCNLQISVTKLNFFVLSVLYVLNISPRSTGQRYFPWRYIALSYAEHIFTINISVTTVFGKLKHFAKIVVSVCTLNRLEWISRTNPYAAKLLRILRWQYVHYVSSPATSQSSFTFIIVEGRILFLWDVYRKQSFKIKENHFEISTLHHAVQCAMLDVSELAHSSTRKHESILGKGWVSSEANRQQWRK